MTRIIVGLSEAILVQVPYQFLLFHETSLGIVAMNAITLMALTVCDTQYQNSSAW